MGILQLNFVPSPSLCFPSNIFYLLFRMSAPVEYHDSVTPEPYTSAPMPPLLTFEEYEALSIEQSTAAEKYDKAINKHEEWKTAKAKEVHTERLRKEKEAHQLKVELLRQEKLEAERKAEEKRLEEEQKTKEKRKEDERIAKELQEQAEAVEHKRLADLKEKEDEEKEKEKEKEDEANEAALQAASAPSASDGDTKVDPADPKTVVMAELRNRQAITEGKKRACSTGSRKHKVRSRSLVDDSEVEGGDALAGLSMPKRLKTEPVPQVKDKVFTGNSAWCRCCSAVFVDFGFFRALWKVPGR